MMRARVWTLTQSLLRTVMSPQRQPQQQRMHQRGAIIRMEGIMKGIRMKGIMEGIRMKGIRMKGIRMQGIRMKGIRTQGIRMKGIRMKGIAKRMSRELSLAWLLRQLRRSSRHSRQRTARRRSAQPQGRLSCRATSANLQQLQQRDVQHKVLVGHKPTPQQCSLEQREIQHTAPVGKMQHTVSFGKMQQQQQQQGMQVAAGALHRTQEGSRGWEFCAQACRLMLHLGIRPRELGMHGRGMGV